MSFSLDSYTLRARLAPVFVLLTPVGLTFLAWFPTTSMWLGALEAIGLPAILAILLSQLGRDLGKKKELRLFQRWNGMPTDRILLSAETFLDPNTLRRYKAKLAIFLPDVAFPTLEYEQEHRDKAIEIYRSCTNFLRERTRDQNQFSLVYAENVNYGFRRNLWGMKPAGVAIALLALIGAIGAALAPIVVYPIAITAIVFDVVLLVFWIFRITPNWVRLPAEEYARQLFAACETF